MKTNGKLIILVWWILFFIVSISLAYICFSSYVLGENIYYKCHTVLLILLVCLVIVSWIGMFVKRAEMNDNLNKEYSSLYNSLDSLEEHLKDYEKIDRSEQQTENLRDQQK